jgi:hypothetical protein
MSHESLARRAEIFDRTSLARLRSAFRISRMTQRRYHSMACADAALRRTPLASHARASFVFAGEPFVSAQDRTKMCGVTALIWMRLERAVVKRAANRGGICTRFES